MNAVLFLAIILVLVIAFVISIYFNISLYKQNQAFSEVGKWQRLAYKDDLTGLYNRTAYNQKNEEIKSIKNRYGLGIILFDIDNFKIINDTQGHLVGDEILRKTGQLLSEVFASTLYSVYRIGGDEFAVIGERITEDDLIAMLIAVQNRFEGEGQIRLSKGYAMIGKDVTKAFKDADEMLYADKASKK